MKKILSLLCFVCLIFAGLGNTATCTAFGQKMNYKELPNGTYQLENWGNYTDSTVVVPAYYENSNKRITSIRFAAFRDCTTIQTLIIKDGGVTEIGSEAFSECINLKSVVLGNTVETISSKAFYNCTDLERIFIPQNVQSIGENAFKGCTNLTIYVEAETRPARWSENWSGDCKVFWGQSE